jgi:hypothetical protein
MLPQQVSRDHSAAQLRVVSGLRAVAIAVIVILAFVLGAGVSPAQIYVHPTHRINAHSESSPTATKITLTLSATSVDAGTAVKLTAQVAAGTKTVTPGQVRFCNASYATCPGLGELGRAALTSKGTAVRSFVLPAGSYSIYVVFEGTTSYATSTSAAQSLTVEGNSNYTAKAVLTNATGKKGTYAVGASLTSHATTAPTGSLVLKDVTDSKTLGKVTLKSSAMGGYQPFGLITTGTTSYPNDLAFGDFNGDGIPDVAVPNSATGVVAVFIGKGDGTFASAVTYSTGSSSDPLAIAVGDVNGDGYQDLVVALGSKASVAILLGAGNGTFQAVQTVATAGSKLYYPIAIVLADFNRDGWLDIATANNTTGVSILLGNGNGSFKTYTSVKTEAVPTWIVAADFDSDGYMDLAVSTATNNTVDILMGNGDGTFDTYTSVSIGSSTVPEALAVSDLDDDGNPDIVVACYGANALGILLGNGDGTFLPVELYSGGTGPIAVSIADLNQDEIPDVIVTDYSGNGISLFQGNGDGTFLPLPGYSTTSSSGPAASYAVDLDGEGTPEIVSVLYTKSGLYILEPERIQGVVLKGVTLPTKGTINLTATYAGDSLYETSTSSEYQFTGSSTTAVAPAFSPVAGTYTEKQTVTLSSTTTGAKIHYTTDGSTPTASSKLYSTSLSVAATETISAITVASGYTTSSVAKAKYIIETNASAPSFSPTAGSYTGPKSVTISSLTSGATIYYTLNGTTPTTSSAKYTGAITLSSSATIKALAVATDYLNSSVSTAKYTITKASLTLASSVSSPTANKSVKLTALLTATNPTSVAGTWTILDGTKTLCTATQTTQTSYGCPVKLAAGTHALKAQFKGKSNAWSLATSLSLKAK